MINGKRIIAILPARGGSKRLPGKNIRDLNGKPLIAWTIDAALGSRYIDTVCVSTDDLTIKGIAERYGAEVPFLRPARLASDNASTVDVVEHAIEFYEQVQKEQYDILIVLQPTSPLRTATDIDESIESFLKKKAANVVSVCEVDHSPLWCNSLPDDLSLTGFIKPELRKMRSQDLPTFYRLNGAVYIILLEVFRQKKDLILCQNAYAYIMSKEHSIDIDDINDFIQAETVMKFYIDSSNLRQ